MRCVRRIDEQRRLLEHALNPVDDAVCRRGEHQWLILVAQRNRAIELQFHGDATSCKKCILHRRSAIAPAAEILAARGNHSLGVERWLNRSHRACDRWWLDQLHVHRLCRSVAAEEANIDRLAVGIDQALEVSVWLTCEHNFHPRAHNSIVVQSILRAHSFVLGVSLDEASAQRKWSSTRHN